MRCVLLLRCSMLLAFVLSLALQGESQATDETTIAELKSRGELLIDDRFERSALEEPWVVNDNRARKAGDLKSQAQLTRAEQRIF